MGKFLGFFNRLDAGVIRAMLVTLGLFALVIIVLVAGRLILFGDNSNESGLLNQLQNWLLLLRDHPLALPGLILIFCTCAFMGAPQFALIAAAVVAFGPQQGFIYAWIATLCSGSLTFWVGRWVGEDTVRKYGGNTINRLSRFIGKNGFLASAIVRNVPTAPFIIVNMAFGVSQARYGGYIAGLAIGVIPKTLLVAFGGQAVLSTVQGTPVWAVIAILMAIGFWIPAMLYARRRVSNAKDDNDADKDVRLT